MQFANDFQIVTRENYWQIASLVTQKSLFTVTHALFFIHPTSHTYVWIYVVHPKNYENKYTTIQCTKLYSPRFGLTTFCMSTFLVGRCISTFWFGLVCRGFGLSMFWSVDVSVCRRFGLLMFWYVDVLVCRRFSFGLSIFRYVSVSVCRRFGCRRFGLSTFWPVTYKRVHVDTPNPVYKYDHHFADDISEWISSMTFFIISLSLSFTSQI